MGVGIRPRLRRGGLTGQAGFYVAENEEALSLTNEIQGIL